MKQGYECIISPKIYLNDYLKLYLLLNSSQIHKIIFYKY